MARTPADPSVRLAKLEVARKLFKRTHVLNGEEMAQALSMTWRNLRYTIDEDQDLPIQRRGSEGQAWEFQAIKVIDHMIAKCRKELARREERAARAARLAGISVGEVDDNLSTADLVRLNNISISVQRRKIEQAEFVRRDEHEAVVAAIYSTTQAEVLATVSRVDAAGVLPPAIRAALADEMKGLLVRLHDQIGASLLDDERVTEPA